VRTPDRKPLSAFLPVVQAIEDGRPRQDVAGLPGSGAAFLLAELFRATSKPLVAMAPTPGQARGLHRDLRFFLGPRPAEAPTNPLADPLVFLPPDERGPYAEVAPDRQAIRERLAALFRLHHGPGPLLVVCDADGLSRVTIPREAFGQSCDLLARGEELDRDRLIQGLLRSGYGSVGLVEDEGCFAVRGGIVDVFCPLYDYPFRLELLGDEVEAIRFFDPSSQRSLGPAEEVYLCPASEALLTEPTARRAETEVRRLGDELAIPSREVNAVIDDLRRQHRFFGLERLLPALYGVRQAAIDYLPGEALFVILDPVAQQRAALERADHLSSEHDRAAERKRLALPPVRHRLPHEELETRLRRRPCLRIHDLALAEPGHKQPIEIRDLQATPNTELVAEVRRAAGQEAALAPLTESLLSFTEAGGQALIACRNETRAERLIALLSNYGLITGACSGLYSPDRRADLGPGLHAVIGGLARGFRLDSGALWFLSEEEIFGAAESRRRRMRSAHERLDEAAAIRSFKELKPDDRVIHVDHGMAIYRGLDRLSVAGLENDFLRLEFAGQDKLFVPVDRLRKVHRYVGGEERARLDKLGGQAWSRTRARVRAAVEALAQGLLEIQAAREARPGFRFPDGGGYFAEFEAAFPFEETPDQRKAIEETLADMGRERPMDRLLCGDVGFGKTEVAMRAAFKAVLAGKQVALLAPTTILAEQHGQTFRDRLSSYPVAVEVLSRFRSPKEQKSILERCRSGLVDVLIGTHRLLSKDVGFHDLGLLIVDEEHRFGVSHKERIKEMRSQVDVLTLTATPIPRTLHMGFSGLKDLSIIATPPADRLSLRTTVMRFDEAAIREAVLSELSRGGQIFFVHNRVRSLPAVARMLTKLVPEARVAMAHGQMGERALERVMLDFVSRRHDLLACTAIIESGLDIPTANTMIVNRADMFGLSQLHQLRGRIGRGGERAYCYLLIPGKTVITRDAEQRLAALQRFSELGAGFQIASHDLEARGAGNLLGAEQSGHIAAVGFDLYTELLRKAVAGLRGQTVDDAVEPELALPVSARIPEDYVADGNQRLLLYKRLSLAEDEEQLDELHEEMIDRFGPLPEAAQNLSQMLELKLALKRLNAAGLEVRAGQAAISLGAGARVDADRLVSLAARKRSRYTLTPEHRLSRPLTEEERGSPLRAARNLLREVRRCAINNGP